MPEPPLAGRGIAITRPAAQAETLAALIRAAGGEPFCYPLLEISPLDDYSAFEQAIAGLERCDWAVFISANAVEFGVPRVLQHGGWPAGTRCAGIGPSTVAALAGHGITQALVPQRADSEGLLALPEMQQVNGNRVIIFRGVGGRELIAETLRARGAEVIYAECYRRRNPQAGTGELARLWQNNRLYGIVITSSEALRNLLDLAAAETAGWLHAVSFFVSHPRIGELAQRHGLRVFVADGADDQAMLRCLVKRVNGEQTP